MLPRFAFPLFFVATLITPVSAQPSVNLDSLSLLDRVLAAKPQEVNPGLTRSIARYIFVNRFVRLRTEQPVSEESCFEIITITLTNLLTEAITSGAYATYGKLWHTAQCLLGIDYCNENLPAWNNALSGSSSSSE